MPRFSAEYDVPAPQLRTVASLVLPARRELAPEDDSEARSVVERYARSSLDSMKLWPPKSYFFSASRRCVIAYAVANKIAIALGDPVGPETEIESTTRQFKKKCKESGWSIAMYRTGAGFLPLYRRLQLRKVKIGDEAIVDLAEFSLKGGSKRDIRSKARHFQQLGIHVTEYLPPVPSHILAKLKNVEEEWLTIPGRRERTFAVGHFDLGYLRSTSVLAVIDSNENLLAFMNVIAVNKCEVAGDLIRRRKNAPNGISLLAVRNE